MKLAEALIMRADCQKRIAQLQQRLMRSAKVQEGEQSPENPQELLAELDATIVELTQLIQRINSTNAVTSVQDQSLSDALAQRDILKTKRDIYSRLIEAAAIQPIRYSQSEVRFVTTVNIAELQRQVDAMARDYRVLDSAIQEVNWQVDLLEA